MARLPAAEGKTHQAREHLTTAKQMIEEMGYGEPLSRRRLLKRATAAGVAVAAPYVITSGALGTGNRPAASNRIVMGVIGTGGMGMNNLRGFLGFRAVQVVAVCDVDRSHRRRAKALVDAKYANTDCKAYNDFREITRRGDIDAVVISTPDHWHVLPALDAARHGKDMYVEKPLTLTIGEGRALVESIRRHACILQTGSQQRSSGQFRFACELVRNGRIGKVHTVRAWVPPNNKECGPTWQRQDVPGGFDYDLWLGPAPKAPYTKQRCHYTFRFIGDYAGGQVTNWGAHMIDIAQWGLGTDASGPVAIVGRGEFPESGLFDTPTKVHFECTYAGGERLICQTGGASTRFEGDRGWVHVSRRALKAEPASLLKETIGPGEIRLPRSRNHRGNFLDCVRTRRQPVAGAEIGHRSATVCHLGNIAMLLGRKLRWDPGAERFGDDDAANGMIGRAMRPPWSL